MIFNTINFVLFLAVVNAAKANYGDAATNAESAALRRAAAKFGLCLNLYDK